MAGAVFDKCQGDPSCIVERLGKEGLKPEVGAVLKTAVEQDAGKPDAK